jgi:hypothetical protein
MYGNLQIECQWIGFFFFFNLIIIQNTENNNYQKYKKIINLCVRLNMV